MYDISKRKNMTNKTVADYIAELQKLPQTAQVFCCGDNVSYIHVEKDGSAVCIDTEDLDDAYENNPDTSADTFWETHE